MADIKLLGVIASLLNIIFTLFIMGIVLSTTDRIYFNTQLIDNILENWSLSPINSISLSNSTKCNNDEELFINNGWKGLVEGCDCTNLTKILSFFSNKKIYRRGCFNNDTFAGCKDIESIDEIPYSNWRTSNPLCIKRNKDLNYHNYTKYILRSGSKCNNGFRNCGRVDSVNNILCLPENIQCPINKLIIAHQNQPYPKDYDYESIELSNGYKLLYTNQATENEVIVNTQISEGHTCSYFKEEERIESYILEKTVSKRCSDWMGNSKLYDDRYFTIDEYNKTELFQSNNITDIVNKLPSYNHDINNVDIKLSIRPYLGWKTKCINDKVYNLDYI